MKGVGFVRNDSAVLWIEQAVAQFFFSIEGELCTVSGRTGTLKAGCAPIVKYMVS